MVHKKYVWIVHKSVTMDNKYHVDTFGKKTLTKGFTNLNSAKVYAEKQAKSLKLKSYDYHDAFEKLKTIKIKGL
jgi:hypothetical protein